MRKAAGKTVALLLVMLLIVPLFPAVAFAAPATDFGARTTLSLRRYETTALILDGRRAGSVYRDSYTEILYFPFSKLCSYLGVKTDFYENNVSGKISATGDITVSGNLNNGYLTVNCRYIYTDGNAKFIDEELCLNGNLAERIFGPMFSYDAVTDTVIADSSKMDLIYGVPEYYDFRFSSGDDLLWLSRLIFAEAGAEDLNAQIAVGNVVMNRVKDPFFADTIKEVIFEKIEDVVQFSPAENTSIYLQPTELSYIAACICLEGYNIVGDAEYFVSYLKGDVSWFRKRLELVDTIGTHEFYRVP